MEFFVPSEPRPKQSYRATTPGHGYTPARVKAWQVEVGWEGQQAMHAAGIEPRTGKLAVQLDFYLGDARVVDLDNLSKCVLDGLNKICWDDDQQVMVLTLRKHIDRERPGVAVRIAGLEEESVWMVGPEPKESAPRGAGTGDTG